jgi:hypothetical protein
MCLQTLRIQLVCRSVVNPVSGSYGREKPLFDETSKLPGIEKLK